MLRSMALGRYLVIDTETTGLNPTKHGLIELAAVAMDENFEIVGQFCMDVCPPESCPIDPSALKVNGFTPDRISNGATYLECAELFLDFTRKNFNKKPMLIGQFLPFDYAVLDNLFTSTGLEFEAAKVLLTNQFIDTKSLALALNLRATMLGKNKPFPSTSLSHGGGLKDTFGVEGFQAHSAMGDVLATREVFISMMQLLDFTYPAELFGRTENQE